MKSRTKTSLMIILATATIGAAQAQSSAGAAGVRAVEDKTTAALLHHDQAAYAQLMSDSWHGQGDGGKLQDRAWLMTTWFPKQRLASMTVRYNLVRVMGATAIVLGDDVEKSSYAGKDTSGRYTWMDVLANEHGAWRVVASQVTKVG